MPDADRSEGPEIVERLERARRLHDIVASIEPRSRAVWVLRNQRGLEPREIQRELGITPRMYRRLFERANAAIKLKLVAVFTADWCPAWRGPLTRLAAGMATDEEAREARRHLAECSTCPEPFTRFTRLHPGGPPSG